MPRHPDPEVERRILTAASRLWARGGEKTLTMRAVAKAAGTTTPTVYERYRAIVRGEPLVLAHGTFERIERNQNVVVRTLETLAPIARKLSGASDLVSALPDAHHFGHR